MEHKVLREMLGTFEYKILEVSSVLKTFRRNIWCIKFGNNVQDVKFGRNSLNVIFVRFERNHSECKI